MATVIEAKDVPRENLFMVGIVAEVTERDLFVIQRPRQPFVINRAEALSLIGHLITKADFTVTEIENAIKAWTPQFNLFEIEGDDRRVILRPPINSRIFTPSQTAFQRKALVTAAEHGVFMFNMEEGKMLCASLVRIMGIQPRELEAGVIAIFDHARDPSGFGETATDMLQQKPKPD